MIHWSHADDPTICEFGSGNQAQIAAAQVSTEAQREAQREALAFAREQFTEAKANRRPFIDAGQGATSQLMSLLGINQLTPGTGTGGTGGTGGSGGATFGNSLGAIAGGVGGSGGRGGSGGGSGSGFTVDANGNKVGTADVFSPAFLEPTVDKNGAFFEPRFPFFDHTGSTNVGVDPNPGFDPLNTEGLPPLVPGHSSLLSVSSGGKSGDLSMSMLKMIGPSGQTIDVPASLASTFRGKGFSFTE